MDDVLRHLVPFALWLSGAAKAVDVVAAGSFALGLWLALPVLVMAWRFRVGAAMMAVAWLPWVLWSGTTHPLLVALVAALLAVFPAEHQRRLLFRTQLTALYVGAGVAKLLSPRWVGGDVVGGWDVWPVTLAPASAVVWGTVIVEIAAGVLLWVNDRAALAVGLVMHAAITVGMWWVVPAARVELLIFNGLAAAMLIVVTRSPASGQRDAAAR